MYSCTSCRGSTHLPAGPCPAQGLCTRGRMSFSQASLAWLLVFAFALAAVSCWAASTAGGAGEEKVAVESAKRTGEADLSRLSVDESVRIAVENNRVAKSAREELEIAQGRITSSWSGALPWVGIVGTYDYMGTLPSAEFDSTSFSLGVRDRYTTGLSLRQPLYKGGKVAAGLEAARLYDEFAGRGLETTLQSVAFDAARSYYDVLLAMELKSVSEKTLELARKHYDDIRRKNEQGFVSDYDVLRARVEVANSEALAIDRRNSLDMAMNSFLKVLGLPLERRVELADALKYVPSVTEEGEAAKTALESRPEIARQELAISMRKQSITAIAGDMKPSADLVANWEGGNATRFSFGGKDWADGWDAGFQVTFPLFDGMRTKGKLQEEKARLAQDELALAELREAIKLEVRQSVLNLQNTAELVKSQEENVKRAEEGARLASMRYEGGEGTQLEVMDAREALAQASSNYWTAVYGHMMGKLRLEKATGTLKVGEVGEKVSNER